MDFLMGNELCCDAFSFADMDIAAERVCRAIEDGESIAVYGDYDADGVSATAVLWSALAALTVAVVLSLCRCKLPVVAFAACITVFAVECLLF